MTPEPVSCTANGGGGERLAAWQRLLRSSVDAGLVAGGIRVSFLERVAEEVMILAAAEQRCCAWARWMTRGRPDGVELLVTTDQEAGVALIHLIFAAALAGSFSIRGTPPRPTRWPTDQTPAGLTCTGVQVADCVHGC